jgi:hypothetical protein
VIAARSNLVGKNRYPKCSDWKASNTCALMLRLEASSRPCALICTTCALHVHIVSKKKRKNTLKKPPPHCIKVIELQSCKPIKYTTITMPAYDNYQHSHDHSQMESYNTEALQQFQESLQKD